jgi:RNA polymerase sigma factor (sigma-70 family)
MKQSISSKEYGVAYENGRRQTVNFLLSKGLREEEANEKAQAAWAKGWERRFQLRDKEKTLSWVNTIAYNLYRSSIRKESLHGPIGEIAVSPDVSLTALDLEKMLKQCRENEHEILKLRYLKGYDIKDLAGRYSCTETAVRVRLLRARRSLRAKFW